MQDEALRVQIVEAMNQLARDGLNGGSSGNISARFENSMLISPSGVMPADLAPQMVCKMDLASPTGDWEGAHAPSSEWRFHRDILNSKPDVGAVVHTHAQFSTILSILRRPIPPIHYMVAVFGGSDIPVTNYARFGSQKLSDEILRVLQDRRGCLMANHGMIVAGSDVDHALWLAGELETLSSQFYHTESVGGGVRLSDAEMADVVEALHNYGPKKVESDA